MMVIDSFSGRHRFLSNFYPVDVEMEGAMYPTVEHAYQAAKCDKDCYKSVGIDRSVSWREAIQTAKTAGEAKRIGKLSHLPLRRDWEDVKLEVMYGLLVKKFSIYPFRDMLVGTGAALLVEGNNWGDTYWGVCGGKGDNWLGRLLMMVRLELGGEGEPEDLEAGL